MDGNRIWHLLLPLHERARVCASENDRQKMTNKAVITRTQRRAPVGRVKQVLKCVKFEKKLAKRLFETNSNSAC